MAQSVKLSISAAVTNGPTVKGDATFDIATYGAVVDELVCKCNSSNPQWFPLPPFAPGDIDFILVTADKFSTDQTCPPPSPGSPPLCKKFIRFWFGQAYMNCPAPNTASFLQYPTIIPGADVPSTPFAAVYFVNELTIDVKVSVLIVQKSKSSPLCIPPVQQQGGQQQGQGQCQQPGQQYQPPTIQGPPAARNGASAFPQHQSNAP